MFQLYLHYYILHILYTIYNYKSKLNIYSTVLCIIIINYIYNADCLIVNVNNYNTSHQWLKLNENYYILYLVYCFPTPDW